ncbi:MAG: hypothetical protein PHH22_00320 [Clostridia bacterium]|nr:hypothetical protein [Clostridia bacterium]
MYDVLEKVFAIILAVLLMFFFPLLDVFERMDDLSFMTIYSSTVRFVDTVRNTGRITPKDYLAFKQVLDATGNKYEIELLHRQVSYYPENDNEQANGAYGYIELFDEFYKYQILAAMDIMENVDNYMVYNTNVVDMLDYEEFRIGDYFYVSVKNVSDTPATVMKRVLYGTDLSGSTIVVSYGGMIRNVPIEI